MGTNDIKVAVHAAINNVRISETESVRYYSMSYQCAIL